jgi:hypothetical protein
MSVSPGQKEIRLQERRIGQKAAKAVEVFVHRKIGRTLTIRNKGGVDENGRVMKPIIDATKVRAKTGTHRLLGLNLTSNKYGFIQHYGASTTRIEHTVLLSNDTSFIRRSHPFQLKSKDIFENIYQESGALEILSEGLSETRTKAVKIYIRGIVVELNKQDGR